MAMVMVLVVIVSLIFMCGGVFLFRHMRKSASAPPPNGSTKVAPAPSSNPVGKTSSDSGGCPPDQDISVQALCGNCKREVKVSATQGACCQFTCPFCHAINEFTIGGISAGSDKSMSIKVRFPTYWQVQSEDAEQVAVQESAQVRAAMQKLVDATWKSVYTRDRGRVRTVPKFEVVAVQRNENPKLWASYYRFREQLAEQLQSEGIRRWEVKTQTLGCKHPEVKNFYDQANMRQDLNEYYLFHGTSPAAAKAICQNHFRVDKAGSNAGTLYGPGIYLAEASTKADEYATDDKDSIFTGLYGMIVNRVLCGNIHYNADIRPPVQALVDSIAKDGTHHAIMGDREKCRHTYREFIVFNNMQVYPEYVVIYKRIPT